MIVANIYPSRYAGLNIFLLRLLKVNIKRNNGEQDTFLNDCKWTDSAPYRTITIKDIISDLPAIRNGEFKAAVLKTLGQKLPFFLAGVFQQTVLFIWADS